MTAGRGFPAEASAADGVVRGGWRRYSICTVVTKAAQYGAMVEGFAARGFAAEDCEFLYVDNSAGNRFDAHAAYNLFLDVAAGDYVILCHQDVVLLEDGRARLDAVIAELDGIDPAWGLFGNAGGARLGRLAMRITDPSRTDAAEGGPFPVRCYTLDENFIVVRRAARLALPRDRGGFHFYGTELCLMADILGWHAYVVDFHLHHLGAGLLTADFLAQLNRVVEKYQGALRPRWLSTPCTDLFLSSSRVLNVLMNRRLPLRVARWLMDWRSR